MSTPNPHAQQGQAYQRILMCGLDEQGNPVGLPIAEGGLATVAANDPNGRKKVTNNPVQLSSGLLSSSLATLYTAGATYKNVSLLVMNITDRQTVRYIKPEVYHVRTGQTALHPLIKNLRVYEGEGVQWANFNLNTGDTVQGLCNVYQGMSWILYGELL